VDKGPGETLCELELVPYPEPLVAMLELVPATVSRVF
jgi:hypothetical protein